MNVETLRFTGALDGVDPMNSIGAVVAFDVPVSAAPQSYGVCTVVGSSYTK